MIEVGVSGGMSAVAGRSKGAVEVCEGFVDALSHDGRGVVRVDGKAVFVHGALPGERIAFCYTRRGKRFDDGEVATVLEASADRVEPRCPHFGVCGGCVLQHLRPEAQVAAKQRVLLENLERLGGVVPERVASPVAADPWGYRRKARLGIKYVHKKGRVLVGFRERRAPYVADLSSCHILDPAVGMRLNEIADLIESMEARTRIPQVEVAVGDDSTALVFRHLDPLEEADRERLRRFAQVTGLQVWVQSKGPDTAKPLWPEDGELHYRIPAHDVSIGFRPVHFTQVNGAINRAMVDRVVQWLDPEPRDRILDLFAGLGNFTLPIARRAREVVAVEGDEAMARRAEFNARSNGIDNTQHVTSDLFMQPNEPEWMREPFQRVLLDPPRAGAAAMMPHLGHHRPGRIVYVSCHAATLARDVGELVRRWGYRLSEVGVMDMFPHTGHVESIACLDRED